MYEVVLKWDDQDEVRLTDRPLKKDEKLQLAGPIGAEAVAWPATHGAETPEET